MLKKVPSVSDVLVIGSLSGRIDHGLGLLSELYKEQKRNSNTQVWLFSETNISFVLSEGETRIALPLGGDSITENVGILPIFGAAKITLKGFEWDVEDWETEMGAKLSTSNHIRADEVMVKTDRPVLFTVERR